MRNGEADLKETYFLCRGRGHLPGGVHRDRRRLLLPQPLQTQLVQGDGVLPLVRLSRLSRLHRNQGMKSDGMIPHRIGAKRISIFLKLITNPIIRSEGCTNPQKEVMLPELNYKGAKKEIEIIWKFVNC